MLSFWILLFLFCCDCNNGCGCARNDDRHDCNNDWSPRREGRREKREEECQERRRNDDCDNNPGNNSPCGCMNDFVQPRPFSSFPGQNTCGCENKSE